MRMKLFSGFTSIAVKQLLFTDVPMYIFSQATTTVLWLSKTRLMHLAHSTIRLSLYWLCESYLIPILYHAISGQLCLSGHL